LNQSSLNASVFVKKEEEPIFLKDLKKILKFLIFCYKQMVLISKDKKEVLNDFGETELNNLLRDLLQSNKWEFALADYYFSREEAESDEKTHKNKGFTDIKVIIPPPNKISKENRSFIFECKRLGKDTKLNNYYIVNGIIDRFITGKYCPSMDTAGMIGFIQKNEKMKTPNIQNIIDDINKKIIDKHNKPETEKLKNVLIQDDFKYSYISEHKRDNDLGNISLYHLMFDLSFC